MKDIIFWYFIVVNIVTFILFGVDKKKAINHKYRISEFALMTACAIGGSLGGSFGMNVFHHKTKHMKFVVGIPLIVVIQLAVVYIFFIRG